MSGPTVELSQGRLLIDGRPRILFCGEVHYFRLARSDWRSRLEQLKAVGAQAVASYMPWLVHELPDGTIDVTGETEDWRDLGAFCDLAAELGLYVVARPGPFVMAELKNEGIPYRVYDLPGVAPTTWDDRPLPTRDVDYLSPAFLVEVARWYDAVLPVLAARLHDRGGPVIAVQLDNEVGMLAWVSNSPPISEGLAEDFLRWMEKQRERDGLATELTGLPDQPDRAAAYLRRPPPEDAACVADRLMRFSRARFTRYTDHLAQLCREHGITTVPFLINIHGTGQGRGLTYPIGISQLLGTWRNRPQVTAGSDMYLGDLTVNNVADFVVGNIFARAVQGRDQPLTALEFEAGDGDYGQDLSTLVPPEAVGLRTRLAHGLGNRLMNYYLFTGGINPPLPTPPGLSDGLDRIAFTGEQHGFAAPIGPTGDITPGYTAAAEVMADLNAVQDEAAELEPHRDLTLGFVSDHYLTEYRVPGDAATEAIQRDLERFRGMGSREVLARALVLGGFGLDAVDLCRHPELEDVSVLQGEQATTHDLMPPELSVETHPALAIASAHHLAAEVQQRLADYVAAGGRLLLAGVLPTIDQRGQPCTVLADALGVEVLGERGDQVIDPLGVARPYFATVQAVPGWLKADRPEVRVGHAQLLQAENAEVLLTEVATGEPCAVDIRCGAGRVIILAADYPCDLDVFATLLGRLDVMQHWSTDAERPGLVLAGMRSDDASTELLHVVNVAPYAVTATIHRDGLPDPAPVTVGARGGLLLRYAGRSVELRNDQIQAEQDQ